MLLSEELFLVKSSLVGNLLIAPPIIKTGFWAKSVALVTEHSKYSIGVILNKRSQVTLKEFGVQLGFKLNYPGFMYVGGPVNVRNLILLHSSEWTSGNMMCINDDISLSSDEEILPRLSISDTPKKWRLFLGLCRWTDGQLEEEIYGEYPPDQNVSWCIAQANQKLIFDSDLDQQWAKSLDQAGLEFSQKMLDY